MIKVKQNQSGATFWQFAFTIFIAVVFLSVLFKLLPVYLTDLKVKNALEVAAQQSAAQSLTDLEIREAIQRQFDIEDVEREHIDLDRALRVQPGKGGRIIKIQYERLIPYVYNVSFLIKFNHEQNTRFEE